MRSHYDSIIPLASKIKAEKCPLREVPKKGLFFQNSYSKGALFTDY